MSTPDRMVFAVCRAWRRVDRLLSTAQAELDDVTTKAFDGVPWHVINPHVAYGDRELTTVDQVRDALAFECRVFDDAKMLRMLTVLAERWEEHDRINDAAGITPMERRVEGLHRIRFTLEVRVFALRPASGPALAEWVRTLAEIDGSVENPEDPLDGILHVVASVARDVAAPAVHGNMR